MLKLPHDHLPGLGLNGYRPERPSLYVGRNIVQCVLKHLHGAVQFSFDILRVLGQFGLEQLGVGQVHLALLRRVQQELDMPGSDVCKSESLRPQQCWPAAKDREQLPDPLARLITGWPPWLLSHSWHSPMLVLNESVGSSLSTHKAPPDDGASESRADRPVYFVWNSTCVSLPICFPPPNSPHAKPPPAPTMAPFTIPAPVMAPTTAPAAAPIPVFSPTP